MLLKNQFIILLVGFALVTVPARITCSHDQEAADRVSELLKSDRIEEALQVVENSDLENSDNGVIRRMVSVVYNNYAMILSRQGNYREAVDYFSRALNLQTDEPVVLYNYACCLFKLGRHYDAISNLEKVIYNAAAPAEYITESRRKLAEVYFDLKDYDRAQGQLRELAAENPKDLDSLFLLGRCYYQQGYLADALRTWQQIIDSEIRLPDDIKASLLQWMEKARRENSVEENFVAKRSQHFKIKFDCKKDDTIIESLTDYLEQAYSDIGKKMSYYPDQVTTVIVYETGDFLDVTQAPSWTNGLYGNWQIRIPLNFDLNYRNDYLAEIKNVIFHEYTHLLVHSLTDNRCPIWLNEGLAVYSQPDPGKFGEIYPLKSALGTGTLKTLKSLQSNFVNPKSYQETILNYTHAYHAVKFILNEWSYMDIQEIFELLKSGQDFETCLDQVLGESYESLNEKFLKYIEES